MKKLMATIGVAALLATVCTAQEDPVPQPPPNPLFGWIELLSSTNTGWTFALGPSYSPDLEDETGASAEWGVSGLAGYWIAPNLLTGMRFEYFGHNFFAGEASATVQLPMKLFGKLPATPFLTSALGMPVDGAGDENGSPAYIAGTGIVVHIWTRKNVSVNAFYEIEKWWGILGYPVVHHPGAVINVDW